MKPLMKPLINLNEYTLPTYLWQYGRLHSHGGILIAGWFIMENPNLKCMRIGGTSIYGKPHIGEGLPLELDRENVG